MQCKPTLSRVCAKYRPFSVSFPVFWNSKMWVWQWTVDCSVRQKEKEEKTRNFWSMSLCSVRPHYIWESCRGISWWILGVWSSLSQCRLLTRFVCMAIGLLKLLRNLIKCKGRLQAQPVNNEPRIPSAKACLRVKIEKRQSRRLALFKPQQFRRKYGH